MRVAQIVGVFLVSHDPFITAMPEVAPEVQSQRILVAFGEVRRKIESLFPDALIVIGCDHMNSFFLDQIPTFCVWVGSETEGPVEDWLRIPRGHVPLHSDLSHGILRQCLNAGFDLSFAEGRPLDHAFMVPWHLLNSGPRIPMVPIHQNCAVAPLPTLRRCYSLGQQIRKVVLRRPNRERVVVIGTGGISHWVGTPETGRINVEFDRDFLALVAEGRVEQVISLTDEQLDQAGNGAHEIRNWVTAMGTIPEFKGRVLAYEPIHEWIAGTGVVELEAIAGAYEPDIPPPAPH
jgi:hypothetical protein